MSKLKNGMSLTDVYVTMAGRNRGAMLAVKHILATDSGRQIIGLLDLYGIYGTDLHILYSEKCHGLVRKLHTLLMATRVSLITVEDLLLMAKDQMDQIHFTEETCRNFETALRKAHEQTQEQKKRAQSGTDFKGYRS